MDLETLAMAVARGRIAVGLGAVALPRVTVRVMRGRPDDDSLAPVLARMLGARDVSLGLGTIVAIDRGKPVRGWLEGAALADAVDCVACLIGRNAMAPNAYRIAAGAGAMSAALGVVLSRRLDPPRRAHPGQPEAVATGHPS